MYKDKRVLALIPARGGSKGLPRKNIRVLAGKPLIAWSIEQARASTAIDRLIVSTEDDEIAKVSRKCGADVPFLRPVELASDAAPVSAAILHAMRTLEKAGERYDIVMLLECTSPIRYPGDIDKAVATLVDTPQAQSVVGVVENTHAPPAWNFRISDGVLRSYLPQELSVDDCRRQALDPAYVPYCLYLAWWKVFEEHRLFYRPRPVPYLLRKEQMVEIDEEVDFIIAETLMRKYLAGTKPRGGRS